MVMTLIGGTLASILHVISGPDHLAAVTPLALESHKKAWKIGLSWGFGHVFGMLIIGVLFIFLKARIPLEEISNSSEQLVGFVLVGIGIWAIHKIFRKHRYHIHPHFHLEKEPYLHTHKHQHSIEDVSHIHYHEKEQTQSIFSSFTIGVLHGLAGVAHFLMFLPILGFTANSDSLYYIFGFTIGTLIAMTSYTIVLGKLTSLSKQEHDDRFFNGIRLAGGLFVIIIGIYWIFSS